MKSSAKKTAQKRQSPPVVELLERRVLYSADSFSTFANLLIPDDDDDQSLSSHIDFDEHAFSQNQEPRNDLVFIDSRIPELQSIAEDIKSNNKSATVIIIDSSQSGVSQISDALSQEKQVDSIHLISHSLGSSVRIGSDMLSIQSISEYSTQINEWRTSLTAGADILIYGCELGSSIDGIALMHELASVTGADVAISDDNTGHHSSLANWELEMSVGEIATNVIVSEDLQSSWHHILNPWDAVQNTLTVDYKQDKSNTDASRYNSIDDLIAHAADAANADPDISLREAISAANNANSPANITIMLNGDYQLTLDGLETENNNEDGDLDILRGVTLEGTGSSQTSIIANPTNASTQMRIIDTPGNDHNPRLLNMSGIKLSGGNSPHGGGAIRMTDGILTLTDMLITGNNADNDGGAILLRNAAIDISHSLLNNNTSGAEGGAIFIDNGDDSDFFNVTIDNNNAGTDGGGLYAKNNNNLGIINSDFTNNTALRNGGAIFIDANSVITAERTNIENNDALWGGGIYVYGTMNLERISKLIDNEATNSGGGAYVEGATMTVDRSTIRNNAATTMNGGGIGMWNDGTLIINDSILSFNRAETQTDPGNAGLGGAINVDGTLQLTNSLIRQNNAHTGGGLNFEGGSDNSTITNTTIYLNNATEDGGAIVVNHGRDVIIESSTIVLNNAQDNNGAIDTDGAGSRAHIKNTIISANTTQDAFATSAPSNFQQVANGVKSNGFNLITDGHLETYYQPEHTDIISDDLSVYTVDAKLSNSLASDNGSHSQHLKLLSGSDAIDAGTGFWREDAYGLRSNEFVDIGAVEYQSNDVGTKLFWIDSDPTGADAVYRMNEDGRAFQQIIAPLTVLGVPVNYTDIAYDPKSRHIFLISYTNTGLGENDSYYLIYRHADGTAPPDPLDYLSTAGINTGNWEAPGEYASLAISVGETAGAASNVLYVSQNEIGGSTSRIQSFEINYSVDAATQNRVIDAEHLWITSSANTNSLNSTIATEATTLDVARDQTVIGDAQFFWGDSSTVAPEMPDFTSLELPSNNTISFLITDDSGDPVPNDLVSGITYDDATGNIFLTAQHQVWRYPIDPGNATDATFLLSGSDTFSDIDFDHRKQLLWFVDVNGKVGFLDSDLTTMSPLPFPANLKPHSLAVSTSSIVNTPPRPSTSNNPLDVDENNTLIDVTTITDAHLSWTDVHPDGDTSPLLVRYTLTSLPSQGTLYIDNTEAVDGATFTQQDIIDSKLTYIHSGDEPDPATDSFAYTVSDLQSGTNDVYGRFDINITEVNDLPTLTINDINLLIDENDGSPIAIASATASDIDGSTNPVSILVTDSTGAIRTDFSIDAAGLISSNTAFDFESDPFFDIQISVLDDDNDGASDTRRVDIVDLNDDPTDIVLAGSFDVPELTENHILGTISTVDPDVADTTHTYVLSDTRFEIVAGQLQLATGVEFNFEAEPTIPLMITTNDGKGGSFSKPFTINVTNLNDNPTDIVFTGSLDVPELTPNHILGTISTSDPDVADTTHTYVLSDTRFEIVAGQLQLASGVEFDHEAEPTIPLTITANDGNGGSFAKPFTINVTDLNDNPTDIVFTGSLAVPELTPNHVLGTIATSDPDVSNTHTYVLSDTRFEIVAGQLQLATGVEFDHEAEPTIPLTITTNDGNGGSFSKPFTINVTNLNDDPIDIVFSGSLDVPELTPNHVLGTISTSDPDVSDTTHTYGLSDARFEIVAGQLQLATGVEFDYEAEPTIALTITANDGNGGAFTKPFTINVTDLNDEPTDIVFTGSLSVPELTPNHVLGTITTSDQDISDTHNYVISDTRFEIAAGQLQLAAGVQLSKETEPTIALTITTNDGNGGTYAEPFTINVIDLNDGPTDIVFTGSLAVPELTPNHVLGTIVTSDPDASDNHTYALSDTRFEIIAGQLQLATGVELDFEAEPTIPLTIITNDGNGGSFAKPFTINVTDLNDDPTDIVFAGFLTVPELTPNHVLGTITTNDPDVSDTHTYVLSDTRFEIVAGQLQLASGVEFDHEAEPTIPLTITANDGNGGSFAKPFTIIVADLNDDPTDIVFTGSLAVPELTPDHILGTITTSDSDVSDTHSYVLSDTRFEIVAGQLQLASGVEFDHETEPTIALTITANDGNDGSFSKPFTINVIDLNDDPVDIVLTGSLAVPELTPNHVLGTINTSDPDVSDTAHTYVLSDARFEIIAGQLQLAPGVEFNFESEPTIPLTIITNDGNGGSFSKPFTINVTNLNDDPIDIVFTGSLDVPELTPNHVLGTISTSDPDVSDTTHTYGLSDARFEIVADQLQLVTGVELDHETEPTITLTITTNDGNGGSFAKPFIINVTDQNDDPTDILFTGSLAVPELTPDHVLGTINTSDQDVSDTHTYALSDARFEIVAGQLQLANGVEFDHEAEPTIALTITTNDGNGGSFAKPFTINVTDQNDVPTDIILTGSVDIPELSTAHVFGTLSTSDADVSDTAHSYLVSDSRFEVIDSQLQLVTGAQIDHETEPTIPLTITSDDGNGGSYSKLFLINVINQNDSPTDIAITGPTTGVLSAPELSTGAVIGTLSTTDEDNSNSDYSYTVSDDRFEVINNQIVIKPDAVLDFETEPTITFSVTTNDGNGETFSKAFTLNVTDENDDPTDITLSTTNSSMNIPELTDNFIIGSLATSDADVLDTIHTYSVVNIDNPADDRFEVNAGVLSIKPGEQLDIDDETTITLAITSTDDSGGTITENFTFEVMNVNENPIVQTVPNNLTLSVEEPLDLSQVEINDPDNDSITYSVVMENGESLPEWLDFDPLTGLLTLVDEPDSVESINLLLVVTDGNGGTDQAPLLINVQNSPTLAPANPEPEPEPEPQPEPQTLVPAIESPNLNFAPIQNQESESETTTETETEKETVFEIGTDSLSTDNDEQIDLASLIKPLEKVEHVDVVPVNASISRINQSFDIDLVEAERPPEFFLNLQDAFNQPSNIEFDYLDSRLDKQKQELEERVANTKTLIGSSFTVSSGLSVGYLLWLVRSGALMGSVMSSLPSWRLVDPLPILSSLGEDFDQDDETLESMVDEKEKSASTKAGKHKPAQPSS